MLYHTIKLKNGFTLSLPSSIPKYLQDFIDKNKFIKDEIEKQKEDLDKFKNAVKEIAK